jgi:transposase
VGLRKQTNGLRQTSPQCHRAKLLLQTLEAHRRSFPADSLDVLPRPDSFGRGAADRRLRPVGGRRLPEAPRPPRVRVRAPPAVQGRRGGGRRVVFGPRRVRGKRGRGVARKTIVFGIFKRDGRVYTEVVPDCSKATLSAVIRGRIRPDLVIHSDGWPGFDGLVDVGYAKHPRVRHGRDQFVRGKSHINGVESFWGYAERRQVEFNGVPEHTFYFHLKEADYVPCSVANLFKAFRADSGPATPGGDGTPGHFGYRPPFHL